MIVYTVTGTVGQAGYLDIANSGDITGKNIYATTTMWKRSSACSKRS